MKIKKIKIAAAGAWARDCELLCLAQHKGLKINYHRDGDDTYWKLQCERIIAYQVISEEFSRNDYLINMPVEGAFFEILDSPSANTNFSGKDRKKLVTLHHVARKIGATIVGGELSGLQWSWNLSK